jgi:hypothetical protein
VISTAIVYIPFRAILLIAMNYDNRRSIYLIMRLFDLA